MGGPGATLQPVALELQVRAIQPAMLPARAQTPVPKSILEGARRGTASGTPVSTMRPDAMESARLLALLSSLPPQSC